MEPNQNQGQSQEPVEAPMPEQNAFSQEPVTEKKTGNGMLIGMILCALIALGGVGFGVWAMMDGNSQVAKKDEQIADLRGQLAEKSEAVVEDITVVDVEGDNVGTSVNVADYIYIGEWGLKIRIPEGLQNKIDYNFSNGDYLEITDFSGNYTYGQKIDWNTANLLMISRSVTGTIDFENCMTSCSKLITTLNGYDYAYVMTGSNLELLQGTLLNEMTKAEAFSEFEN